MLSKKIRSMINRFGYVMQIREWSRTASEIERWPGPHVSNLIGKYRKLERYVLSLIKGFLNCRYRNIKINVSFLFMNHKIISPYKPVSCNIL